MKDAYWKDTPGDIGVFGGHVAFGDPRRNWNFRSLGRGDIQFEEIIRALNSIRYKGPLSVEWEDSDMDREEGAAESCEFVRGIDFKPSGLAFDAAFEKK
jgi:sugar phosphate isomerase/epimerase